MRRFVLILGIIFCLIPWPGGTRLWAAYYPASPGCSLGIAVSQTANTDVKTFVNNGYICMIYLHSDTAQFVSIVQGTGTNCGTSTVALIGATTAANGMSFGANGGSVNPIPSGSYLKTTTPAQHLCILQTGSGRLAGFILYIDAP
jgi:hypothetical protein